MESTDGNFSEVEKGKKLLFLYNPLEIFSLRSPSSDTTTLSHINPNNYKRCDCHQFWSHGARTGGRHTEMTNKLLVDVTKTLS